MDRSNSSNSSSATDSSDNNHSLERLDIIIPNQTDYDQFIATISDLIELSRKEQHQFTHHMQLLQYHYRMTLNKDWQYHDDPSSHNHLSLSEWTTLCENLQVPVKKQVLQLLFKEQCRRHRATEKLSLSTIVSLLDSVREIAADGQDPIHLLWKELVRTDPVPMIGYDCDATTTTATYGNPDDGTTTTNDNHQNQNNETSYELGILREQTNYSISSVALLSFIRSQQKNYTASLEQITEMVRQYDTLYSGEAIIMNQTTNNIIDDAVPQQQHHLPMMEYSNSLLLNYMNRLMLLLMRD